MKHKMVVTYLVCVSKAEPGDFLMHCCVLNFELGLISLFRNISLFSSYS